MANVAGIKAPVGFGFWRGLVLHLILAKRPESNRGLSTWLTSSYFVLCVLSEHTVGEVKGEKVGESLSSLHPAKGQILRCGVPPLGPYFDFNYFGRDPMSQYSHTRC